MRPMRQHWPSYLLLSIIWAVAYVRVAIEPIPRLPLAFNWTPSLPYRVAWVRYGVTEVKRGDLIVYAFDGRAQREYPGLRHQPFFKRVSGLPGDRVTVRRRWILINGQPMGFAKRYTFDGRPLTPIANMTIPKGFVYAQGDSSDSFDSRYASSGLVRLDHIAGVARPLW